MADFKKTGLYHTVSANQVFYTAYILVHGFLCPKFWLAEKILISLSSYKCWLYSHLTTKHFKTIGQIVPCGFFPVEVLITTDLEGYPLTIPPSVLHISQDLNWLQYF